MLLGKGALVLVSGRGQNNWARWTFDSITWALSATAKHADATALRQKRELTCTWPSHTTPIIYVT